MRSEPRLGSGILSGNILEDLVLTAAARWPPFQQHSWLICKPQNPCPENWASQLRFTSAQTHLISQQKKKRCLVQKCSHVTSLPRNNFPPPPQCAEMSSSCKPSAHQRLRLCINNFLESTSRSPGRADYQNLPSAGMASGKKYSLAARRSLHKIQIGSVRKKSGAPVAVKARDDSPPGEAIAHQEE